MGQRVSAALEPFSGGAAYLNYLTQRDSEQDVRVAYGSNLNRLASLKSKYDPSNFFNSIAISNRRAARMFYRKGSKRKG
jgi:hypothetical protein